VEPVAKEFKAVYVTNAEIGLPDEEHQTRINGGDITMDPKTARTGASSERKGALAPQRYGSFDRKYVVERIRSGNLWR
jgi:hypothetical protein